MFEIEHPTELQQVHDDFLASRKVKLYLKRDDLIHPEISGNKWRKLKYNFIHARENGFKRILTFGGAFSNHIAAVAFAANQYGFESIGIIRGEELNPGSNPTLVQASQLGMGMKFVTRAVYGKRNNDDFLRELESQFGRFYFIPEGGSNVLAVKGCSEIINEIDVNFDYIFSAVGTGGTLAGLASGIKADQQAIGVSVLKGAGYLNQEIEKLIESYSNKNLKNWQINHEYHLGGYAKFDDQLIEFINRFRSDHDIQLDPVYTGKMIMAIYDLIEKGKLKTGTKVVALHTGGLQGIQGFNKLNGELIQLKN